MIQASAHGILPVFATRNDRANLLEILIANYRVDFVVSIFPGDNNDSINRVGALKCAYRVRDDWLPAIAANNLSKPMRRLLPAAAMMAVSTTLKR